jgi:uncharacterized protein with PQ loop repeat
MRSEYVRKQRKRMLTVGIFVPFVIGAFTFCITAPLIGLINIVVPHLPWNTNGYPVESPIVMAWFCARCAAVVTFALWIALFVFVPKSRTSCSAEQP